MTPGPGRLAPVSPAARIDANGTMWRLRSLLAMGHDCARIARALGVPPGLVRRVVRGQGRTVTCQFQRRRLPALGRLVGQDPAPAHSGSAACRRPALRQAKTRGWPAAAGTGRGPARRARLPALVPYRPATGTGTAPDFPPARPRPLPTEIA